MNQEKIGNFITKCRQEKKLTQQQLANKLGITNKAVSKWENGRGMPDYSLFNDLCKILDISVIELLNGEKNKKEEKVITEYITKKDKKSKNKLLLLTVITIFIIIFSTLLIYFINNYKNINIYELSGQSNNFIYENGILISSNIKNIIEYGNIKSNIIDEENIQLIELTILKNNEYYLITSWNKQNDILIEQFGYEENFIKDFNKDLKNNLYLIIYYKNNNLLNVEKIKIKLNKIFSNDKIINKKIQTIAVNTPYSESNYKKVELKQYYYKKLLEKGFLNIKNPLYDCKECLTKKISDTEYISIDTLTDYIYYNYKENDLEIRAIDRLDNSSKEITFNIKSNNKWTYLIYEKNNGELTGSNTNKIINNQIKEILNIMKEHYYEN